MGETFRLEGGGLLELREQGAHVQLSVHREGDQRGLYKAWIRGSGGELLLGTLAPEGGQLVLRRSLSRDSLRQAGCLPVTGGRCAMVYSFSAPKAQRSSHLWHWEQYPARRLSDPLLSRSAAAWGPMLCREEGEGFSLAIPLERGRPFPLTPIFCLARVRLLEGRPHAIFSFDSGGGPKIPEEE